MSKEITVAYIGNGVYIDHTEQGIVLYTSNGIEVGNKIVLEDLYMIKAINRYIAKATGEPIEKLIMD